MQNVYQQGSLKMRKRILFGSLLATLAITSAAHAETLQQATQQTIQTNPQVLAAVSQRLASDQALRGAKGGYLPSVDLNAGYGREKSRNETTQALPNRDTRTLTRKELGAHATQELFTGFSTVHDVGRTRAEKEGSAHELDDVAEDTAMRVVEVYVAVIHRQHTVAAGRTNVKAHQRTYDMIRKRADSGISKKADVEQARGRLALAQANLNTELGNLREARAQYIRVVGHAPDNLSLPGGLKTSKFDDSFLPATEKEALDRAVAHHPQLMAADADIVSAQQQHKAAQSTNYPQLRFDLGLNEDRDIDGIKGENYDYEAMLRATYNIYNGGSDLARQRETALLAQQSAQIRNNTYRQVEENVRLSWAAMQTNKRLLTYYTRQRDAAKATVVAYRKQFKLGQRTLLDLLDSENEYFTSSLSYLSARYDVVISKYRVVNSTGYLLDELAVLPPPEAHSQKEAKEEAAKQEAEAKKEAQKVAALRRQDAKKLAVAKRREAREARKIAVAKKRDARKLGAKRREAHKVAKRQLKQKRRQQHAKRKTNKTNKSSTLATLMKKADRVIFSNKYKNRAKAKKAEQAVVKSKV